MMYDSACFPSGNSLDVSSPSPQRWRGVRSEHTVGCSHKNPGTSFQPSFGEFIQWTGIPLTPHLSPALGRGEPTCFLLQCSTNHRVSPESTSRLPRRVPPNSS